MLNGSIAVHLSSPKAKRGRKSKPYPTSWGSHIEGLRRRGDGRWEAGGVKGKVFTEPDERKAVARALQILKPSPSWSQLAEDFNAPITETAITDNIADIADRHPVEFYAFVANAIMTKRQYVASMTGIEQIGYLENLTPAEPIPSLTDAETFFVENYPKAEYSRRIMDVWKHFKKETGIAGLLDITKPICRDYRKLIQSRLAPKTQQNHFDKLRRFFKFLRDEDFASERMGKIGELLVIMKPSGEPTACNPNPMSRDVFHTLMTAANDFDKAVLLTMLNGAFGVREVCRLRWDDIKNGTITTRRKKRGQHIRVCVLWKETIAALAKLPKTHPEIFVSREGKPISPHGVGGRFRKLRKRAKLTECNLKQLRSGAATAMRVGGINNEMFSTVMGHSGGIREHYILADASQVAPASLAIHKAYLSQ